MCRLRHATFPFPGGRFPTTGLNPVLGVLAAIIVWGRFGPYHF